MRKAYHSVKTYEQAYKLLGGAPKIEDGRKVAYGTFLHEAENCIELKYRGRAMVRYLPSGQIEIPCQAVFWRRACFRRRVGVFSPLCVFQAYFADYRWWVANTDRYWWSLVGPAWKLPEGETGRFALNDKTGLWEPV